MFDYIVNNELIGTIPEVLSFLPYLTDLILVRNMISGTLSTSLGSLLALLKIDLSHNRLQGTIPTELGLSDLTFLLKNCNITEASGDFFC